jgi:hypothetical protein
VSRARLFSDALVSQYGRFRYGQGGSDRRRVTISFGGIAALVALVASAMTVSLQRVRESTGFCTRCCLRSVRNGG